MRKVSATVIYKDNILYNLTVNYKGDLIPLTVCNTQHYPTFQAMYKAVLNTLKNNNFYCSSYSQFNSRWYDIQFIDLNNPTIVGKYGYKEGV